jgi:hypothetical protein
MGEKPWEERKIKGFGRAKQMLLRGTVEVVGDVELISCWFLCIGMAEPAHSMVLSLTKGKLAQCPRGRIIHRGVASPLNMLREAVEEVGAK